MTSQFACIAFWASSIVFILLVRASVVLLLIAQCVLPSFRCGGLVGGCGFMKLILVSLGRLLLLFFPCSCAACSVSWPSVISHCEPSWIVSLLVHFVGLLFHWSFVCACCCARACFPWGLCSLCHVSWRCCFEIFMLSWQKS